VNWSADDWARLGDALRIARQHRGLSQDELAKEAQVSTGSVQGVEAGKAPKSRMPYTVAPIARALGWPAGTVESVLGGEVAPASPEVIALAQRIERLGQKQRAAVLGILDAFEARP
jgi:transcriptional regulator with XRE-family HTH domain